MKKKILVSLFAIIALISTLCFGLTVSANETPQQTASVNRVTSVHEHSGMVEEVSLVFNHKSVNTENMLESDLANKVHPFIELNGIPLATIDEAGTVLATWCTDAHGDRCINVSLFNNDLPAEYLFKDGGGDVLLIKAGFTTPEGYVTEEDVTFTYNATTRIWARSPQINALDIESTAIAAPAHIDIAFLFNYAPDVEISNNFMTTLGGAYNDPTNPASPIYFDYNNAYWGDLFDKVYIASKPVKSFVAAAVNIQFWWYGNGTANRSFIIRLCDAGAIGNVPEGSIVEFMPGFHTPEGVTLENKLSFQYLNGQMVKTEKELDVIGFSEAREPTTPYIDLTVQFNIAPSPYRTNADLINMGGAFNDPNNPASAVYFGADNPYWGDNFNKVLINDKSIATLIAEGKQFQFWWSGNTTANRTFIIRYLFVATEKMFAENETLTLKQGFVTPDGYSVNKDLVFVADANGTLKKATEKELQVKKVSNVSVDPNYGALNLAQCNAFNVWLNGDSIDYVTINNDANFNEHFLLNGKTSAEWGSSGIGQHVQVHRWQIYNGVRLDVYVFDRLATGVVVLNGDGSDVLTLKAGLNVAFGYVVSKDINFYNYGANFAYEWYDQTKKDELTALDNEISALTGESSREEYNAVLAKYNQLSDKDKSVIKNAANFTTVDNILLVKESKPTVEITYAQNENNENAENVINNVTLQTSTQNGCTITWESSNPAVIATDGTVVRPRGIVNAQVTLTATISKGEYSETKQFTLTVICQKYFATFANDDMSLINVVEQNAEGKFTAIPNPEKAHYTFVAWYNGDTAFDFNAEVTADVTLVARYAPVDYTITYNLNGGVNGANPATYNVETANITLANATKEHYTFAGWYSDQALENVVETITCANGGNLTLYAKWIVAEYTITYNDAGTNSNPATYTVETANITLANATKEHYTFAGWYSDQALENVVETITCANGGNVELFAKWTAVEYTITYNDAGTNSNPATYTVETANITLANATKEHYTFGGWYSDETLENVVETITCANGGNVTLYAKWTAVDYTITYNLNGGANGANPATYNVETANITLANATKEHYTFGGWYSDETLENVVETITCANGGNVTLYAKWTVVDYTITYNLNGGTNGANSATYNVETANITLANATKEHYTFAGWYTDEALENVVETITCANGGNVTLYAKWTAVEYTITYNDAGTNSNPATYTVESEKITLAAPTKEGFNFEGWYSDEIFETAVTEIETAQGGNVTVYAKWSKQSASCVSGIVAPTLISLATVITLVAVVLLKKRSQVM